MFDIRLSVQRLMTALAVLAMVASAGLIGASSAAAQAGGDSHGFDSGETLTWDGGWELDPESATSDSGIESVLLTSSAGLLMVMNMPNNFDLEEARDIVLDSFLETGDAARTIDRGSYGSVSYSLDAMTLDDTGFGVFTLFRAGEGSAPTYAYVFVAITDYFAGEFAKAQDGVTLDGAGLFEGVNGQGLQDQLEAEPESGGTTTEDESTPEDEPDVDEPVEPTPEGDDGGNGGGGLKGGSGSSADTGDEEDADPTPVDDEDAPVGSGLVDDNTFVSPTYGPVIEWVSPLQLNPDRDPNVVEDSDGLDRVSLSMDGDNLAFVNVTILEAGTATPANMVAAWSSPDFIESIAFSPDSEVVLADSSSSIGAVARVDYTDEGTEVIFYTEFIFDEANGALILVEYSTAFPMFDVTFDDAQASLTVDGESVLEFFAPDEIAEAAGI